MKIIIFFKNYYFFYIIYTYKLEVVHTNMKRFKKLYEYVIDIQLDYQFTKQIFIDENTKTVWFELVVLHSGREWALIESKREITFKQINKQIKELLLDEIERDIVHLICELNLDYEIENIFEQLDSGFVVNGKEFLLEDNNYVELRKKVLKEVKQWKK